MAFFYSFLIVAVDVFCIFAWMSKKCIVLDEDSPYPGYSIQKSGLCPGNQLKAICKDVADFTVDLSTIPKDINVLCVWVDHGSTLKPEDLSKFHSLRSLYIYGCLSAIFPETFSGLNNLQLLSMSCPNRCNASIPSKVFHDLYNLEELKLENYDLSNMAADVFYGLHVKRLDVKGTVNFSELICKLSFFSDSVEFLSIEMDVETLTTPNCTYGPSHLASLRNFTCSFPYLKKIEGYAFKYTENVSVLRMPMNDDLCTQLLHSGIQHVDQIHLEFIEVNIQSICEVIFAMSIPIANLQFKTLQDYSVLSWEKCNRLEELTLTGWGLRSMDLSFISTLKYVFNIVIVKSVKNIFIEDKSLMSLCTTNVSLSSLRYFSYFTNQNLTLRTRQFVCLSHLKELYLDGNNIHVENFAFEGLYHLKVLSFQALTSGESTFKGIVGLRSLWFHGHLVVIKPELFSDLVNVESIIISLCYIQTIKDFAFTNLIRLRYMDLSQNRISKITANTFFGLKNLEHLILEKNPLSHLEASSFAHFPSLKVLCLGNLKFTSTEHTGMRVLNLSLIFGRFPRQLSDLTITSISHPITLVIADDSTPDVNLSLSLSGQKIIIWGCERPFLKSVTKLSVVTDTFLCAPDNNVAFYHFMSVVSLRYTHVQVHVSTVQSLSGLNRMDKLKRLDLANINFINLSGMSIIFQNLTRLESLSLSYCWVDSLEGELTVDLTSLKYFFLDDIETGVSFSTGFFEHLTNLKFALLYDVQLRCTCDNVWFLHWARNQQQAEVCMINFNGEPQQCMSEGSLQDLNSYGQAHCSHDVGFMLFVSTSWFLLLFMTCVLLHQLARDYMLALYHIAHGWLNEVLRDHQNTRGRYLYDAFVSYSGRDERWVVEELMPNLEQRGPPFLRLCLHSRDFQLGKDIVENITDSLYRSRRTVCLISRHYLRSNWCSLEMRLGTYRLQVEHRDVLILVFLEKIPDNLLSAHHRLARFVKTRTYIEWPQDPAQQEAFWERLWKKLLPDEE